MKSMQAEAVQSPETRRFPMLQADEREKLERGFAVAEASLFLEGLRPSENFFAVKARILAGEITFEQGQEEILDYHQVKVPAVA
ncbi:MAG: antitoxin VbhA family protein [Terracidiphilus sp.]